MVNWSVIRYQPYIFSESTLKSSSPPVNNHDPHLLPGSASRNVYSGALEDQYILLVFVDGVYYWVESCSTDVQQTKRYIAQSGGGGGERIDAVILFDG